MNEQEIAKELELHKKWLNDKEGGKRADFSYKDLQEANLQGADLRGANLRGADLDFSCLPLWCGSFDIKVSDDFVYQLLYHVCKLKSDVVLPKKIKDLANKANIRTKHNLPEV